MSYEILYRIIRAGHSTWGLALLLDSKTANDNG